METPPSYLAAEAAADEKALPDKILKLGGTGMKANRVNIKILFSKSQWLIQQTKLQRIRFSING